MTRTRNLSDLLDSNGDVKSDALDNVISEVADDTTPALGGNLDVSGNSIVSSSNGDISITPNGTGSVVIDGLSHPQADGTADQLLKTDGAGNLSFTDAPSSDLVDDTTPQLGGDLDTNNQNINFGDNDKAQFGAGNDLQIYHNGSASVIKDAGTGNFFISGDNDVFISKSDLSEVKAKFSSDGAVELNYDNSKKLETTSSGVNITGVGKVSGVSNPYIALDSNASSDTAQVGYVSLQRGGTEKAYWGFGSSANDYIYHYNGIGGHIWHDHGNARMRLVDGVLLVDGEGGSDLTVDVRQGSAKMWLTFENQGTHSTYDSYNVSSTTDIAVGNYQININNDFNNSNYSMTCGAAENGTGTDNYARMNSVATNRRAAGSSRHWSHESWSGTARDLTYICNQHFGDLA